jgi:hypothetical protein
MRARLGLRSPWFRIGVLSLASDKATVVYGGSVTLRGLARDGGTRGWGSAFLQRKRYGEASWTAVGTALPDGQWSSVRRPRIRTDYRVTSDNATGIAARVYVRTKVTFTSTSATRLKVSIGPARSGITVTLKRQRRDGTWRTVATTRSRTHGAFVFWITVPGKYRALADAGDGYLRGSAMTLAGG